MRRRAIPSLSMKTTGLVLASVVMVVMPFHGWWSITIFRFKKGVRDCHPAICRNFNNHSVEVTDYSIEDTFLPEQNCLKCHHFLPWQLLIDNSKNDSRQLLLQCRLHNQFSLVFNGFYLAKAATMYSTIRENKLGWQNVIKNCKISSQ
jgi:hypothetical protein